MSHVLTQQTQMPAIAHINSDQFVAMSAAVLMHIIVVALLLVSWDKDKPLEPKVNTIKVRIMTQTITPPVSEPVVESMQLPEPILTKPPTKEPPVKQINEAQFAKKRVEEIVKEAVIEPQTNAEVEAKLSPELQQKDTIPTESKQTDIKQADIKKTESKSEPQTANNSQQQVANFDTSQYFPVQKEAPNYPPRALDKGVQGTCTVRYTVNTSGLVEGAEALDNCHAFFIKPSLEATKTFRYTPRIVDGKAVKVSNVKNTFQYRIE